MFLWLGCCVLAANGLASETEDIDTLSIEELMGSKVVSATRTEQQLTDTAAAAYVITQDDIKRSGATTIPEALRMVPGLHVARISPGKWAISARGSNGLVADKLLVLMDGRSLYSPIHKGVYWDIQDRVLDDIERIEVIRGPGASVWGANAVNGVINIITKHSTDTKDGSASAFVGDKFGASLRQGWEFSEKGQARVYGKFLRDESFDSALGKDAKEEWLSGRGGFRVDWADTDGKHALMAQGDIFYGTYNENNDKRENSLTNQLILNRRVKQGGNLMARWNYNQSLASHMTAQIFYDNFEESQTQDRTLKSEIIDLDFQHVFAANEQHEITWGLNYRLSLVGIGNFEITETNISLFRPGSFQNQRFSVFFQDKWRWSEAVELTLGSKFEHHTNNDFEYEPSLRVLWKPANQHRVWAGLSRAVRLPAVSDLIGSQKQVSDGTIARTFNELKQHKKMTSDEVISYELGYRYWDANSFSLDLAAYYNLYTNNLTAYNEFFKYFPEQSIKESRTIGFEAAMSWRPLDWLHLQASSSFMDTEIQSRRVIPNLNNPTISTNPQFLVEFRSSFDLLPEWETDLWLRYVDAFSGGLTTQTIPSFVSLNARLAWKPSKNIELAFVANNLNDSRHPEFYDSTVIYPLQVERQFWLQANLKY